MIPDFQKSTTWLESWQALHARHCDKSSLKMKMSKKQWRDDTGRGKLTYLEKILLLATLPHIPSDQIWTSAVTGLQVTALTIA